MPDHFLAEALDALEKLGILRIAARRRARIAGAEADVIGLEAFLNGAEPVDPFLRRTQNEEGAFEALGREFLDIRRHAVRFVELGFLDPSRPVAAAHLIFVVADPSFVGEADRPMLAPLLVSFFAPEFDLLRSAVEVRGEPPDPSVPIQRPFDSLVVKGADPDGRARLLVRFGREARLIEFEETALE